MVAGGFNPRKRCNKHGVAERRTNDLVVEWRRARINCRSATQSIVGVKDWSFGQNDGGYELGHFAGCDMRAKASAGSPMDAVVYKGVSWW